METRPGFFENRNFSAISLILNPFCLPLLHLHLLLYTGRNILYTMIRLLRRLHTVPEAVLSADHYLRAAWAHRSLPPKVGASEFERHGDRSQTNYTNVYNNLGAESPLKSRIQSNAATLQSFLGPLLPLEFPELVAIMCGLSNSSVKVTRAAANGTLSTGSTAFYQQETLRLLGSRFFDMHCTASTVFADLDYLSTSSQELEDAMGILRNNTTLITRFMLLNNLDAVLIPWRGVHSAGLVKEEALELKSKIRDATSKASFFTMVGLLTVKFGSAHVLTKFWDPVVLNSNTGIIKIALDSRGS